MAGPLLAELVVNSLLGLDVDVEDWSKEGCIPRWG